MDVGHIASFIEHADEDVVLSGKYGEEKYAWILMQHPSYAQWVLDTCHSGEGVGPQMLRLDHHLLEKATQGFSNPLPQETSATAAPSQTQWFPVDQESIQFPDHGAHEKNEQ